RERRGVLNRVVENHEVGPMSLPDPAPIGETHDPIIRCVVPEGGGLVDGKDARIVRKKGKYPLRAADRRPGDEPPGQSRSPRSTASKRAFNSVGRVKMWWRYGCARPPPRSGCGCGARRTPPSPASGRP